MPFTQLANNKPETEGVVDSIRVMSANQPVFRRRLDPRSELSASIGTCMLAERWNLTVSDCSW
jgi:hypothetical protein